MLSRNFISLILFLCCVTKGQAQNTITAQEAADIFLKINQAYTSCKSMSMDIEHSFYRTYSDSVPEYHYSGYYMRKNMMENSCIAGIISIQDDKYRITVDTANKDITFSNPVLVSAGNPSAILALLKLSKNIYLTKSSGSHVFLLVFAENNPEFSSIRISIDPESNFIQSIVIYHSEEDEYEERGKKIVSKNRTEILYSHIKKNPSLPDRKFSLSGYISLVDDKPVPAKDYSDFEVIDNVIR